MSAPAVQSHGPIKHPIDMSSWEFIQNKYAYYRWLREEAPVYKGKLSIINAYLLSRYDDCVAMLKDSRFVRDRTTVTGGTNRLPIPVPKAVALLARNMILADEPEHRRLRNLVHKAFTLRALARLEGRIEQLTHELLDVAEAQGRVDLMQIYRSRRRAARGLLLWARVSHAVLRSLHLVPDARADRTAAGRSWRHRAPVCAGDPTAGRDRQLEPCGRQRACRAHPAPPWRAR